VPGAKLFALDHPIHRAVMQALPNLVCPISDNHMHSIGLQRLCGGYHVFQQWASGQYVQYFREPGFHPCALPGGKDDHFNRHNLLTG
jgi:hypothetical protein